MRKALIFATITCLILSGCSNKPNNDVEIGPVINQSGDNQEELVNTSDNPGYAGDNLKIESYTEYDSGIYAQDANLAEQYSYTGITYSGEIKSEEDENIQDTEQGTPEDTVVEPEIGDGTLETPVDTENIDGAETSGEGETPGEVETPEEPITPDEPVMPDIDKYDKYDAITELDKCIYSDLYVSRMLRLNTASNVNDLGGKVDADAYLRNTKRLLENIEYCESLINQYFTYEDELVSSWNEIKSILIRWRTELSNIETIEDFFKSGVGLDTVEFTSFEKFKAILENLD